MILYLGLCIAWGGGCLLFVNKLIKDADMQSFNDNKELYIIKTNIFPRQNAKKYLIKADKGKRISIKARIENDLSMKEKQQIEVILIKTGKNNLIEIIGKLRLNKKASKSKDKIFKVELNQEYKVLVKSIGDTKKEKVSVVLEVCNY